MAEDGAIDAESHLIKAEAFDMDKVPCTEIIEEIDTSDEEDDPDVEEIQDKNITSDNHTICLKEDLTALKEVFDDEVCTSMIIGWYDACSKSIIFFQKSRTKISSHFCRIANQYEKLKIPNMIRYNLKMEQKHLKYQFRYNLKIW